MCKSIISVIDEFLDVQDVDNSITKVLSKVCKHLPADKEHKVIWLDLLLTCLKVFVK